MAVCIGEKSPLSPTSGAVVVTRWVPDSLVVRASVVTTRVTECKERMCTRNARVGVVAGNPHHCVFGISSCRNSHPHSYSRHTPCQSCFDVYWCRGAPRAHWNVVLLLWHAPSEEAGVALYFLPREKRAATARCLCNNDGDGRRCIGGSYAGEPGPKRRQQEAGRLAPCRVVFRGRWDSCSLLLRKVEWPARGASRHPSGRESIRCVMRTAAYVRGVLRDRRENLLGVSFFCPRLASAQM